MKGFDIELIYPSDLKKPIEKGRHFNVWGRIIHTAPLAKNAVLRVELLDRNGGTLRFAEQRKKNSRSVFAFHPALKGYPDEMDPGREKLVEFGFPELMVKDIERPYDSLRDATLKCWYSDDCFKALIVSGTDKAHGMPFDDGIGYTDAHGEPYDALESGEYTLKVTLASRGRTLAQKEWGIRIGERAEQMIFRFNPVSHKKRMLEWCAELGFDTACDTLPGYLEPYLGKWLYHMGLTQMYNASDLAFYDAQKVRLFVYLMQKDSTSYSCELPYLQTKLRIGDEDRFEAYCYDIGEAELPKSGQKGAVRRFEKGEYLYVYRLDTVSAAARENNYEINGADVIRYHTQKASLRLPSGERFAVCGAVRPWQRDPAGFIQNADNSYSFADFVTSLEYAFECEGEVVKETRLPGMERAENGVSFGTSALEFYNIFTPRPQWKGKTVRVRVQARGEACDTVNAACGFEIRFE